MTSRERFTSCMNYTGIDRLPCIYAGTPKITEALREHFASSGDGSLEDCLGVDIRNVAPRYCGPELLTHDDGSFDGIWGERYKMVDIGNSRLKEAVYLPFADVVRISDIDTSRLPTPDWWENSRLKKDCENWADRVVSVGYHGATARGAKDGYSVPPVQAPDFINGIARNRGMQQVLLDIAMKDPVLLYLMDYRTELYCENLRRSLEAAEGRIDLVWFADDIGNQNGPMLGPDHFRELFLPRYKKLFDVAHAYGAKTMMHSCGSVRLLIPLLIESGLDILDVLQPEPEGMDLESLKDEFYREIAFCGSMSVQTTLPQSTPQQIRNEVRKRSEMFAEGGLIIGPTNAIQGDTPLENVLAMYEEVGSITDILNT